ncbi:cell wall-active antibiotics response protein LiaF [Bacillus sp. FJAT-45350]|uniref:cell wall-active antibiotics response protein LiaF n=1 Tax=Bacillus sp. FJAT-45350 TaxID=2011014 RepID=UPI000BB7EA53|nr:cell wall-active antibiotics response protein LiaF [Bacillus sp. FJAT-45350]
MKTSRNVLIGMIIILIGVSVLFNTFHLNFNLGSIIGPLIFFVIGLFFYQKQRKVISLIFFLIAVIALFENVFRINIAGILVALAFIYFGYRLLTGSQKRSKEDDDWFSEEIDKTIYEEKSVKQKEEKKKEKILTAPTFKSTFIGDLHLLHHQFELRDMNIRNGIGDIKIDLSKAIIPEGETVVIIQGWIGDIDIYIPYDLDVHVQSMVTIGDLNVLESRQSGFNPTIEYSTSDYKEAERRVKIVLSLFIGDIDVRYV